MSFVNAFKLATEDAATTAQAKREDEIVVYCKINNFDGLKNASYKESQEQWEVKSRNGKIRVRKTTVADLESKYSMAIKVKDKSAGFEGNKEVEFDISADAFEALKAIAHSGMNKDRYVFKTTKSTINLGSGKTELQVPDLVYEVDVFHDGNGGYHPWCKIDIEINDLLTAVGETSPENTNEVNITLKVSDLPFQPSDPVVNVNATAEQNAFITKLYDEYFLITCKDVPPVQETKEEPVTEPAQSAEQDTTVNE